MGYPSLGGGVFVYKRLSGEELPHEFAKVEMAFTMDERCYALADLDATFNANVKECEEIPKSLEDGIGIGRYWERRMGEIDGY